MRALLVRWSFTEAAVVAALLFGVLLFSPLGSSLAYAPTSLAANQDTAASNIITRSETESYYLQAINDLRASYDLKPLFIDARLSNSATSKGQDMITNKYWGHYPVNGESFAGFVWANSPKATTVGENLAKCYASRQAAFAALKNSPTHLANMLGNYQDFGVAEIYNPNDGCTHTIMHFAAYK